MEECQGIPSQAIVVAERHEVHSVAKSKYGLQLGKQEDAQYHGQSPEEGMQQVRPKAENIAAG